MTFNATYKQALRVWWALLGRSILMGIGAIIVSALLGNAIGTMMMSLGFSLSTIRSFVNIFGFLIGLIASILPFDFIINKNYGEFDLHLLSLGREPVVLHTTWGRLLSIWWAYVWRNFLLIIATWLVTSIITRMVVWLLTTIGVSTGVYDFFVMLLLIAGLIGGLALSVIPVQLILNKKWWDFKLALVAKKKLDK